MANFFRALGAATPALNVTARTLMEFGQQMREAPLLKAQAAVTQQRAEQMKFEMEQAKKEAAELDAPVDGTIMFQGISEKWTESKKKQAMDMLKQRGVVDERGFTTKRKMQEAQKAIMLSREATKWYQEAEIEGERMIGMDLYKEVQKAKESGDPRKIDEATNKFREWQDAYNIRTKGFDQFNKTQTAYYLRDELQKAGKLTPELDAMLIAAYKGGEGLDDVLDILKQAVKGETQGAAGRPFSVSGGIYDPEAKEFKQPPWAEEGGTGEEEKWTNFGYGQMRNTKTGEVVKVPTKPATEGKERAPWQVGKDIAGLRKEFNALPDVKEYNNIKTKSSAMEKALELSKKGGNMVAVDQALISLYNKLTDPQSVVRESEYARTPQNMPVVNRILGKWDKIMSGGAGLTQDERQALVEMAREINSVYSENYSNRVIEYRGYAKQMQLDPDQVAPMPKVGAQKQSGRPLPTF